MNQTKTVLMAIAEFLLGKKYYANIINSVGTANCEINSSHFCRWLAKQNPVADARPYGLMNTTKKLQS